MSESDRALPEALLVDLPEPLAKLLSRAVTDFYANLRIVSRPGVSMFEAPRPATEWTNDKGLGGSWDCVPVGYPDWPHPASLKIRCRLAAKQMNDVEIAFDGPVNGPAMRAFVAALTVTLDSITLSWQWVGGL